MQRAQSIDPARFRDWEDRLEQMEENKKSREQVIKSLIAEAQRQWQESMALLKNPNVPKTEQMQIHLATECAGLEAKIAKLENDLNLPQEEEEDDEKIQYEIYTLLPDLIDEWKNLSYKTKLRFVGGLVRRVILSHPSPGWLQIAIEWKLPEWGIDTRYIKRTTSNGSGWSDEEEQTLRAMYPSADAIILLNAFPERTWMALRRRAEKLGIERYVENDLTTRDMYAHQSMKDIAFLEGVRKPSRGVKGMDRIAPTMCHSDNYDAWIGSL